MDDTISLQVLVFKQICIDLHSAQSEYTFDHIVNRVLTTPYGDFARTDGGMTLQEIAYVFDITRERVRQIQELAVKRMKSPESKPTLLLNRYLALSGDDKATIKRRINAIQRKQK